MGPGGKAGVSSHYHGSIHIRLGSGYADRSAVCISFELFYRAGSVDTVPDHRVGARRIPRGIHKNREQGSTNVTFDTTCSLCLLGSCQHRISNPHYREPHLGLLCCDGDIRLSVGPGAHGIYGCHDIFYMETVQEKAYAYAHEVQDTREILNNIMNVVFRVRL